MIGEVCSNSIRFGGEDQAEAPGPTLPKQFEANVCVLRFLGVCCFAASRISFSEADL
jgi:hypothetical protein